eukprot:2324606-Amphidinium_carterae.1
MNKKRKVSGGEKLLQLQQSIFNDSIGLDCAVHQASSQATDRRCRLQGAYAQLLAQFALPMALSCTPTRVLLQ